MKKGQTVTVNTESGFLYGLFEVETEKAILLNFEGIDCWIPKSVIEDRADGDAPELSLAGWFAAKLEREIVGA